MIQYYYIKYCYAIFDVLEGEDTDDDSAELFIGK